MEGNVWSQLFAQVAGFVSSLLEHTSAPQRPERSGPSSSAPASGADSTSTSKRSTTAPRSLLQVQRNQTLEMEASLSGVMVCRDGWKCFTLENQALSIPAGQYGLEIYDSPHAGHPVPLLRDVPGRDFVEIHCGNVPQDSKGCILVGLSRTEGTIQDSRAAFNVLLPKIQAALREGPQMIEILDAGILLR